MFGMPRMRRSLREIELLASLLSWHRWIIWSLRKSKKPSISSRQIGTTKEEFMARPRGSHCF